MSQSARVLINILSHVKEVNRGITYRMDSNQEIISRLKFIGKIKKKEKLNTRHMYVQPSGFTTSLIRTFWNQDNRGNTLSFIQDTLNRSFELLVTYERNHEDTLLGHLLTDMSNSLTGIYNLKDTYIDDTKFCCDLDALIEHTKAKLSKYGVGQGLPVAATITPRESPDVGTNTGSSLQSVDFE